MQAMKKAGKRARNSNEAEKTEFLKTTPTAFKDGSRPLAVKSHLAAIRKSDTFIKMYDMTEDTIMSFTSRYIKATATPVRYAILIFISGITAMIAMENVSEIEI